MRPDMSGQYVMWALERRHFERRRQSHAASPAQVEIQQLRRRQDSNSLARPCPNHPPGRRHGRYQVAAAAVRAEGTPEGADAPMNQSREAHHSTCPLHSPRGGHLHGLPTRPATCLTAPCALAGSGSRRAATGVRHDLLPSALPPRPSGTDRGRQTASQRLTGGLVSHLRGSSRGRGDR